ncbi:hypothetical protein HWV62_20936 [Athelia sp. TMB]|nr:hypothetical protein HWV62_20936 [Athelia sp. TMB]
MTILSTITNPLGETFLTAFIAWLPMVRAAAGVVLYAVKIIPERLGDVWLETEESTPGAATYAVWALWHFWVPFAQIDWLVRHAHSASGGLMFARASGVGVGLVGMSVDFKGRVVTALGLRLGTPVAVLLAVYTVMVRLALVGVMFAEYIMAAQRAHVPGRGAVIATIVILSPLWCLYTYAFVPGRDCEADDEEVKYRVFHSWADIPWDSVWRICIISLACAALAAIFAFFMSYKLMLNARK